MIGDSWQLRKHSLLGHWAVHSVEPPGPWCTCEKREEEEEEEDGGGGRTRAGTEQKRRGSCQEPTGEKVLHVLADGGRATYTDGRTDGKGGWRYEECDDKRSVIADERVA